MGKRAQRVVVFLAGLSPLAWLVWAAFSGGLGANPVDTITQHTGIWTLRLLLVALTVTPARRLLGWSTLASYRRMLGLFAFFYATLHFSTLIVFDHFFDWAAIWADVRERPFITAGFTGFVLMIPLALTSPSRMVRALGGRRWQKLHQLVYVCGLAGVVHYLWLVKTDIRPPLVYSVWLLVVMSVRVAYWTNWLGAAAPRARANTAPSVS
jgi:sulfoxide reductase heme-binding subunit YedZ